VILLLDLIEFEDGARAIALALRTFDELVVEM
jgi:hypothetical protein